MVLQKGLPVLGRWPRCAAQHTRDGALRYDYTQHLEFPMDSRRPPQWIGDCHLKNQPSNFVGERWPSSFSSLWLGKLGPESSKSSSLPANHGVRPNEDQSIPPVRPSL